MTEKCLCCGVDITHRKKQTFPTHYCGEDCRIHYNNTKRRVISNASKALKAIRELRALKVDYPNLSEDINLQLGDIIKALDSMKD